MEQLKFTSRVLGQEAASRLRQREVTQTIRSGTSSIVLAFNDGRIKTDDPFQIVLDDEFVGYGTHLQVDKVRWNDLLCEDLRRGGFDNFFHLKFALERAGYRFKPIDEYVFYRCRFEWQP